MSENTERLERVAAQQHSAYLDFAAEARACRQIGDDDGERLAMRCSDAMREEAEWYRSLIPLVEAGERAGKAERHYGRCVYCWRRIRLSAVQAASSDRPRCADKLKCEQRMKKGGA